jgi:hypothetical protein
VKYELWNAFTVRIDDNSTQLDDQGAVRGIVWSDVLPELSGLQLLTLRD